MEAEENKIDAKLPPVLDGLLEKIKNTLFANYEPVPEYNPGVIFMSTREIWSMLQRLYPNEILYSPTDVAQWLHEKGYSFIDHGHLRFEWMLQPI